MALDYEAIAAALDELERIAPGDPDNAWTAVFLALSRPRPITHEAVAAMEAG